MLRKLSETFTATHLVLIIGVAALAPSALYAAVSFSNVAITDANTGATAFVDGGRKLWTYDPIAAYTSAPLNTVNISDFSTASTGQHTIYTVPAGKALLIRSVTWSYFDNVGANNNFSYLYDDTGNILYNFEGLRVAETISANLGPGVIVRAGKLQLAYGGSGSGRTYIQGYLIPATAAPATASMAASEQIVTSGRATAPGRPQ